MIENPIGRIGDIPDVDVSGVADDDFFYYDSASGLWKPRKLVSTDLPTHASKHNFGGNDELEFTDWLKQSVVLLNCDGLGVDNATFWTQSLSTGMTFTPGLVHSSFNTDAVANRTGYLYTTAAAFTVDWFKWIALTTTGAANYIAWLWISSTFGASVPAAGQKCAGFRLQDGTIYAYSADGVAAEETNVGSISSANISYMLKNNSDSVEFYLNSSLVTIHSTRYPGTGITHFVKCYLTNTAAVAKNLFLRNISVRRA